MIIDQIGLRFYEAALPLFLCREGGKTLSFKYYLTSSRLHGYLVIPEKKYLKNKSIIQKKA